MNIPKKQGFCTLDTSHPLTATVRTAAGAPVLCAPVLQLYVWSSRPGMLRDLRDARDEIEAIGPGRIVLHGNPSEIGAEGAKSIELAAEIMGGVDRVGLGIGADGWADDWRRGNCTSEQVIRPLVTSVRLGYERGVRHFVPNLEAAWKRHNNAGGTKDVKSADEMRALAQAIALAFRAAAPDAVFALSSYDQPTLHGAMRIVYEELTRSFPIFTPQVYAAVAGVPGRQLLPNRRRESLRRIAEARAQGWISPDVSGPDVHSDCDDWPTYQGHKIDPGALFKLCVETPHLYVWSAPSIIDDGREEDGRLDAIGVNALALACRVREAGWIGPGAVAELQAALGIEVDGNPRQGTFRALGAPWMTYEAQ